MGNGFVYHFLFYAAHFLAAFFPSCSVSRSDVERAVEQIVLYREVTIVEQLELYRERSRITSPTMRLKWYGNPTS